MIVHHGDHNRANNRRANLRLVTAARNARNLSRSSANTSGVTGVSWHKRKGEWQAKITFDGKQIHLGTYGADFDEAVQVRKRAEQILDFHANHGKTSDEIRAELLKLKPERTRRRAKSGWTAQRR